MRIITPASILFPPRHRESVSVAVARRVPFLVNTDLVLLLFFIGASTTRYIAHPEAYRSFFIAVTATSLLAYPLSLGLVRFRRYEAAAAVSGISTLFNVCWMGFLIPTTEVADYYRFMLYVVVSILSNALVALGRRQVRWFAAFSILVFLVYTAGIMLPRFGASDPELRSVAFTLFAVLVSANLLMWYLTKIASDLIAHAEGETVRNREKAIGLGRLIQDSRGSLRIGEALGGKSAESLAQATEVRSQVSDLEGKARNLNVDARSAQEANKKVVEFTQATRDSVLGQNEVIHETSAALVEIAATIANLARVATTKKSGIDALLVGFDRQRSEMRKVVEGIEAVRASSERVLSSASTILDVSEKTDLLAMNASIEAAHAGNAGRGFGVIAQEIRKLSVETKKSTESISASLRENNGVIADAAGQVLSFSKAFEGMMGEVRDTFNAMDEIIRGLSEMEQANGELRDATRVLTEIANKTESDVNDVAAKTASSAEGMGRIAGFSDDLLAAVEEIRRHFASIETALGDIAEIGKQNIARISELGRSLDAMDVES
jgi:methyl-accepting chemotaxis protein